MVIYEAASAVVSLKCTTTKELAAAVNVLQLLCGSQKPTLRYAAVKTLNKVKNYFKFKHFIIFYCH
jgi:coatomer protein complex subunit gamma